MQNEFRFLVRRARIPLLFVGLLWLVHGLAWATQTDLGSWGVFPRAVKGLMGILSYPLIHGDAMHLFNNSVPLVVLGTLMLHFYGDTALRVAGAVWLLSGCWIWFTGVSAWHIGASGLVYGLAFFLFWHGVFSGQRQRMIVALVVVLFYGGMVWGVLPIDPHVSWEGHLGGALAGLGMAWLHRQPPVREVVAATPTTETATWDFGPPSQTGKQDFVYLYREAPPQL